MKRCKILVGVGCRSDEGLSKPIITRLRKEEIFNPVHTLHIPPADFYDAYKTLKMAFDYRSDPDLVFITGDRIEMIALACFAFHNHIPIAHYLAGVVNDPISTLDDINRHCISLWSDIQLCENKTAKLNVGMLFNPVKKKTNCHIVGISHLDDLEVDNSLVPNIEYDLILYNPTTMYKEDIINIGRKRFYKNTIWIGPNPDPSFFDIKKIAEFPPVWHTPKGIKPNPILFKYYDNLPRPQFLGLLKHCARFITNSSSAYYEAPYFLSEEQIILIGDRNRSRTSVHCESGASNKIVKILKDWWENHELAT